MNEMTIVLGVLLILVAFIGWRATDYYRTKAEEFESLFELSKGYETTVTKKDKKTLYVKSTAGMIKGMAVTLIDDKGGVVNGYVNEEVKLNKDGSIAKKRGRPPKAK